MFQNIHNQGQSDDVSQYYHHQQHPQQQQQQQHNHHYHHQHQQQQPYFNGIQDPQGQQYRQQYEENQRNQDQRQKIQDPLNLFNNHQERDVIRGGPTQPFELEAVPSLVYYRAQEQLKHIEQQLSYTDHLSHLKNRQYQGIIQDPSDVHMQHGSNNDVVLPNINDKRHGDSYPPEFQQLLSESDRVAQHSSRQAMSHLDAPLIGETHTSKISEFNDMNNPSGKNENFVPTSSITHQTFINQHAEKNNVNEISNDMHGNFTSSTDIAPVQTLSTKNVPDFIEDSTEERSPEVSSHVSDGVSNSTLAIHDPSPTTLYGHDVVDRMKTLKPGSQSMGASNDGIGVVHDKKLDEPENNGVLLTRLTTKGTDISQPILLPQVDDISSKMESDMNVAVQGKHDDENVGSEKVNEVQPASFSIPIASDTTQKHNEVSTDSFKVAPGMITDDSTTATKIHKPTPPTDRKKSSGSTFFSRLGLGKAAARKLSSNSKRRESSAVLPTSDNKEVDDILRRMSVSDINQSLYNNFKK